MTPDDDARFRVQDDDEGEEAPPIDYEDEEDEEDEDEDLEEDLDLDRGPGPMPEDGPRDVDEDEEEDADRAAPSAEDGIGRAAAVLKYIVERIVDEPDRISIGAAEDDRGPVLLLRVAEEDRGKVIGRQGRIVQAIRTVVKAATVGTGDKVSVEIID